MDRRDKILYLITNLFNGSQVKFAEAIKRSPAQVNQWVTNRRAIGDALALQIERNLNLPIGWLDKEVDNKVKNNQSNAFYIGAPKDAYDDSCPLGNDEVEVPFYTDISLSAGNGFASDIQDFNNMKMRFPLTMLNKKGINPKHVVCIGADGDSMEPAIPDGAIVGINTGDTQIRDGKLYAINHDGLLRIKVLKKRPGNKILIQSYNSNSYPDEEIDATAISVIGKIFWWSVLL